MENTVFIINIDLPYINSLKGRRKYVNSIKDILKNRNVSVLDISGEYSHEAQIACSFLSLSLSEAKSKIANIEDLLYSKFPELEIEVEVE